jgi:diacylglycerol diphosphate phosphatase/phosphatidate phosphatase
MRFARYFDQDSLTWFKRPYFADWTVVVVLWVLSYLAEWIPVYEREFSRNDPLIDHHHHPSQVKSSFNNLVSLLGPAFIVGATALYRRSPFILHHSWISLFSAKGLARLVTETLKNLVGRLRPDFLARCKWSKTAKICEGHIEKILDGRRSFPSGHSSTAFAGMAFLSLWLAGQTGAWCLQYTSSSQRLRSTRLGRFILSLTPLCWATYVAITRLQDYVSSQSLKTLSPYFENFIQRHHKEDIIVGSLLGIASAVVTYLLFWPSPFNPAYFVHERRGHPNLLYTEDDSATNRYEAERYELARLEDERLATV